MTSERIQQLLQVVWKKVNTPEDLIQFVHTYGNEIDKDFLTAILTIVKQSRKKGEERVTQFFCQVGQILLKLIMTGGTLEESLVINRIQQFLQNALNTIKNIEDARQFCQTFNDIIDELSFVIEVCMVKAELEEDQETIQPLTFIFQAIQELQNKFQPSNYSVQDSSDRERKTPGSAERIHQLMSLYFTILRTVLCSNCPIIHKVFVLWMYF